MDEAQFNRELNKFKLVRRPDYVGPMNKQRTAPVPVSAPKPKVSAGASSASASAAASKPSATASPTATFWDLLGIYAKERMPEADAIKLVKKCEELFKAEIATAEG